MQGVGEKDERLGGGKGKDPSPPPPPPHHEANKGGHRLGPRRRRRPRVRGEVLAVGFMVAAAAYFLLADGLAVRPGEGDVPPAAWSFVAYVLWIAGVNLFVLVSIMN
ncbi:hypothetical protein GUJ93_ZPchr0006g44453 [Zizania palustris]|uniref:Uncharacterized protein n=1 Tax=Zizania palustris TaxID=103762 RepID=A0A8J5SKX3_ZIZPA|nr:hypothetical protein GUJ93_ZPchr0006g44453 [Zizania palustris]